MWLGQEEDMIGPALLDKPLSMHWRHVGLFAVWLAFPPPPTS